MTNDEHLLTDDAAAALCVRVGFALIDRPMIAEVSRILSGYRDAIRAPLLDEIAALTKERDALRHAGPRR